MKLNGEIMSVRRIHGRPVDASRSVRTIREDKWRVAVVDDDASVRCALEGILEGMDKFRCVECFSNGKEALSEIPRLLADVVLMDIFIPGMDGIECTRRLKSSMPHLKIIMVTGRVESDLIEESLRAGAVDYLIKPVTAAQCLATLNFAMYGGKGLEQSPCGSSTSPRSAPASTIDLPLRAPRENEVMRCLANGRNLINTHLNRHFESVTEGVSLARQAGYRARELARLCQVSPRQLERYFQARFKRSPQKWLDELRLREAADLLRRGKHVKEVAFELGFVHPSHFIRKFKQIYHCTPLKFSLADGTEPFGATSSSPSPSAA